MEINEKSLEVLSAVLKMDKTDLTKAIESSEIDLSNRVVFLKEEYETLEKNLKNQEYHKGKEAGFEIPLKESKRKAAELYGVDTEGIKDFDTLLEKIITHKEDEIKTTYKDSISKDSEKILKEIEGHKKTESDLRKKIKELEEETNIKLSEKDTYINETLNNQEFLKVVNAIPFDIPTYVQSQGKEAEIDYLKKERDKFMMQFKTKYKLERIDNTLIAKEGDEIAKDNLFQPQKIESLALEFAKSNYYNLNDKKVINHIDSKKYGNSFRGMSIEDFNTLLEQQGIRSSDTKYLTYLKQYKEANE